MKMKLSKQEFLDKPLQAVTLIGMSGAGKTHISSQLAQWGWTNYSGDFVIGDRYMRDILGAESGFSTDDISGLSKYLGKVGNPDLGGLPLAEFQKRQKEYYNAECYSLTDMKDALAESDAPFVHDSTGSLCEVTDEALLKHIGEQTLFVYLKTDAAAEKQVLKRAYEYPKPLFFPPMFLLAIIDEYLALNGLCHAQEMVPDDFSRWVFPKLFAARKPKYQRLADLYGVSIPAGAFHDLKSADEFVSIIAEYLHD